MSELSGLSTLYISYNGMSEPLVRSQVLNYQEALARRGVQIHLLTFEKEPPEDETAIRAELAGKGIDWHWLPYSGAAGLRGTLRDVRAARRYILDQAERFDFVHCRSFVPALAAMWAKRSDRSIRYLNDVRGFWLHEKRHKGRLGNPFVFALAHRIEANSYRKANAIVTLTHAAMRELETQYLPADAHIPRCVIPTCVDVTPFLKERAPLNAKTPKLIYAGSVGAGYLIDEIFAFYLRLKARCPQARLEILTRSDHAPVRDAAKAMGMTDDFTLRSVDHAEIAPALLNADLALSFTRPDYSKIAMCPTKLAEYLAAGLPVIANRGIGDVDRYLAENAVGYSLPDFSRDSLEAGVDYAFRLLDDPAMIGRGRETAQRLFSLDLGVERYAQLYEALGPAR